MQPSLFPNDVPAPFTAEQEARRLLDAAHPAIWQAIMDPWEQFAAYRESDVNFLPMEQVDAAWWMHRQIKNRAKQLCAEYPEIGLVHHRIKQQDFFTVNGEAAVVFKKVAQRWSPRLGRMRYVRSNHRSQQNADIWARRAVDGFPDCPRFIAAYELYEEMTRIRLLIGFPRRQGFGFDWMYELDDFSEAVLRPVVPLPSDGFDQGFKIKPRKDAEKREA